jgi:hypothetical protein
MLHNICERSARVFGIQIDFFREQRLLSQHRSTQSELSLHGLMKAVLNLLSDDFSQDGLLGEILGSDGQVLFSGASREGQQQR